MSSKRIAIVGEIIISTVSQVEKTDDGYRVLSSADYIAGAGKIANEFHRVGNQTLLVGIVNEDDVTAVRRMIRGNAYLLGDSWPTLRQEFIGSELRIDRGGSGQKTLPADFARMASQIQQFRPDEIVLVGRDDSILPFLQKAGLDGIVHQVTSG